MARFSLRRDKRAAEEPEEAAAPKSGGAATERGRRPSGAEQPAPEREPTMAERLEGVRSWVAQLDRRIGVRTYAGAAAIVLALAAAAVALILVLQLQDDSATDTDVAQLRDEIAGVEDTASEAAQEDVQSLGDRLEQIEAQIPDVTSEQDAVDREISVIQDDIQDLRDQIAEADSSGSGGSGGASGGAAADSP